MTSFVPLITTAATHDESTTTHKPFPPFGPFGGKFPGFPPKATDRDGPDGRGHKGVNGTTTDDDSGNGNGNNNKGNSNNKGSSNTGSTKALDATAERALISVGSIGTCLTILDSTLVRNQCLQRTLTSVRLLYCDFFCRLACLESFTEAKAEEDAARQGLHVSVP